jgi:hypothetical protein
MGTTLFKNCRYLIAHSYKDGVIEDGAVLVENDLIKAGQE